MVILIYSLDTYWFTKVPTLLWIPPSFVLSPLVRNVWQIRVITQGITIIFPFTSEAFPVIFRSWERKLFVIIVCCVSEGRKLFYSIIYIKYKETA